MSDEIKTVITRAIQSARINGQRARIEGEYLDIIGCRILEDLHAAGYIEPGWSDDFSAAPRDRDVLVHDREGNVFVALWDSNTGLWHEIVELQELRNLTHWKPITPSESGE